jgi:glycosyltransferase involved in cell wall biosynthesis
MTVISGTKTGGKRTRGIHSQYGAAQPVISVVTAVFNSRNALESTIKSVISQTYGAIEYIVIDGGSTDGTLDIIREYDEFIDYWVSQPDKGVYDAMNKGVRAATGTWLNFMNAGDVFSDPAILHEVSVDQFQLTAKFIYSDVILRTSRDRFVQYACDHNQLILNHQASVYAKDLHNQYGMYLTATGVTISDYLFFSVLPPSLFSKFSRPIAIYDTTGLSQSRRAVEQRFIVDYLVNGMSRWKFILYFLLFSYYRSAKSSIADRLRCLFGE